MRYYTTHILSANQELTPEGFLLCKNVAIARTGSQLYAAGEVPVSAKDGLVVIERTPDQVFSPHTISSFEGKPVTFDHPTEDVSPTNWSTLAKGVVQHVRQGVGIDNDLLLADLLITDATTIAQVRDGLREVSCGYDAGYEEIEPGRGRQLSIIGNHVALVDKGRCGSRCAIGDSMKKLSFLDRVRAAFTNRDEAALEETLKEKKGTADDEAEGDDDRKKKDGEDKTADALSKVADSLASIETRLTALETRDAKSKDEDEDDESKGKKDKDEDKEKTSDAASILLASVQDVRARVEILSPGMAFPTLDSADAAKTRDALCAMRRKALEAAYAGKNRDAVAPFVKTTEDIQKLTCDGLSAAFIGASEIVRRENNAQAKGTFDGAQAASSVASSITAMNRRAAEFWAQKTN